MKRRLGFTLLETLVALAILAIALSAAYRAIGIASMQADGLRDRMLAEWVAHDRLAEWRAMGRWADPATNQGEVEQGGRRFAFREEIKATPNPLFRRIDVAVYAIGDAQPLTRVTGFISRAQP